MACHNNALEGLGVFAAGVAVSVAAGANREATAELATAYVALRALYTIAYIWLSTNPIGGLLRSAVWGVGQYCSFRLYGIAAAAY